MMHEAARLGEATARLAQLDVASTQGGSCSPPLALVGSGPRSDVRERLQSVHGCRSVMAQRDESVLESTADKRRQDAADLGGRARDKRHSFRSPPRALARVRLDRRSTAHAREQDVWVLDCGRCLGPQRGYRGERRKAEGGFGAYLVAHDHG